MLVMTATPYFARLAFITAVSIGMAGHGATHAAEAGADPTVTNWTKLQASLFRGRTIQPGGNELIELSAPARADDAAVVPVAVRARFEQTPQRYIKRLYLIVDKNPAPLAATFHMTPDTGRVDIETRVRIEEYSDVRVVIEMNDGGLHATSRHVKASGGCSAPAGKDAAAAAANLGKMRMTLEESPQRGKPALAQLMIRHPNASGLAMDQVTRLYAPPHYVRRIDISYNGKPVMSADTDISISENPNFRFYIRPQGEGTLTAEVVDSNELVFRTSLQVNPG